MSCRCIVSNFYFFNDFNVRDSIDLCLNSRCLVYVQFLMVRKIKDASYKGCPPRIHCDIVTIMCSSISESLVLKPHHPRVHLSRWNIRREHGNQGLVSTCYSCAAQYKSDSKTAPLDARIAAMSSMEVHFASTAKVSFSLFVCVTDFFFIQPTDIPILLRYT